MTKSTLTEIDRLEGIAQAYGRNPLILVTGIRDDIAWARKLVAAIELLEIDDERCGERVGEIEANLRAAEHDWIDAQQARRTGQADLDNLMASLSARLER